MGETLGIFVAGIGGVFLGMALLYCSTKLTSVVTDRFFKHTDEK
jgi:Na+-transporting methylmalonyl-CoA/oxaloacetate decarboxylase gamma subunit